MSPAREDVVKTIYLLAAEGHPVTNGLLAREVEVSAPTVSVMVGRLCDDGLVERGAHRTVVLTAAGEGAALRMIRRHRLLETFLVRTVGMSWDEVHEEAESLEHAISDRLTDLIDDALGRPRHDPHGDPIPSDDPSTHDEHWGTSLHDAPVGARLRIERVHDRDGAALRHLAEIGAVPGAVVEVTERGPFGEPLWVHIDGRAHVLGNRLAAQVHGRVLMTSVPSSDAEETS